MDLASAIVFWDRSWTASDCYIIAKMTRKLFYYDAATLACDRFASDPHASHGNASICEFYACFSG
jgi:hypothetical protein